MLKDLWTIIHYTTSCEIVCKENANDIWIEILPICGFSNNHGRMKFIRRSKSDDWNQEGEQSGLDHKTRHRLTENTTYTHIYLIFVQVNSFIPFSFFASFPTMADRIKLLVQKRTSLKSQIINLSNLLEKKRYDKSFKITYGVIKLYHAYEEFNDELILLDSNNNHKDEFTNVQERLFACRPNWRVIKYGRVRQ